MQVAETCASDYDMGNLLSSWAVRTEIFVLGWGKVVAFLVAERVPARLFCSVTCGWLLLCYLE